MPMPEPLEPFPAHAPTLGSRWRHWKAEGQYQVIAVALHSETGEPLVIYYQYRPGQTPGPVWARPLSMWADQARPGVQRFTELS